jgi:hypothetical protein
MDELEKWLEKDGSTDQELAYWIPEYILMRGDKPFAVGGLVDESPANFYLFFYSGGILKIRRAKKKRKNKRTTD